MKSAKFLEASMLSKIFLKHLSLTIQILRSLCIASSMILLIPFLSPTISIMCSLLLLIFSLMRDPASDRYSLTTFYRVLMESCFALKRMSMYRRISVMYSSWDGSNFYRQDFRLFSRVRRCYKFVITIIYFMWQRYAVFWGLLRK